MARIYNIEGNEDSELVHLLELKRINRFSGEISGVEVLNRIGEIYYSWGAYRESYENFMDTLALSGSNDAALTYLAFMAIGQEAFDIAENYFRKLVKIAPNVPDFHLARGVGLSMLKSNEAMRELEIGLSLSPDDETAQFLVALQGYKQGEPEKARSILVELIPRITEPAISYIASKLATAVFYLIKDYDRALEYAERCLNSAIQEGWAGEEYDSRLSVSYMALLTHNMEKASENLMELEIRNPTDEKVMKVSDFRMDIEEGLTSVDTVSPRGFDFISHLQDWLRKRFPEDAIYKLSGLTMCLLFIQKMARKRSANLKVKALIRWK
jgi:tetratricopeptide (TPR) repeat protein